MEIKWIMEINGNKMDYSYVEGNPNIFKVIIIVQLKMQNEKSPLDTQTSTSKKQTENLLIWKHGYFFLMKKQTCKTEKAQESR